MRLRHSKVQRGGVTAQYWYGETDNISADVDAAGLKLRFALPSKGGGDTDVLVTVGAEDLRFLLKELANAYPSLADAFAESAHIAVRHLVASHEHEDA